MWKSKTVFSATKPSEVFFPRWKINRVYSARVHRRRRDPIKTACTQTAIVLATETRLWSADGETNGFGADIAFGFFFVVRRLPFFSLWPNCFRVSVNDVVGRLLMRSRYAIAVKNENKTREADIPTLASVSYRPRSTMEVGLLRYRVNGKLDHRPTGNCRRRHPFINDIHENSSSARVGAFIARVAPTCCRRTNDFTFLFIRLRFPVLSASTTESQGKVEPVNPRRTHTVTSRRRLVSIRRLDEKVKTNVRFLLL